MKDTLKCYVSGIKPDNKSKTGIISFAVPEYGVMFRCEVEGTATDLQIVAFLTFLRFAEHNKDIFKKRELNIFTDFPILAYLMNEGNIQGKGLEAVKNQAEKYARGLHYKVKWISQKDNRASGSLQDIPTMPEGSSLKIKSFIELNTTSKKTGNIGDMLNSW